MTDAVELATLELGLYTDDKYVPPTVASQAKGTFQRSWNALLAVGNALLLFGIALVPWLPVIALAVWLLRRWLKRVRRRALPQQA
jgi:hypothetical protein